MVHEFIIIVTLQVYALIHVKRFSHNRMKMQHLNFTETL